MKVVGYVRVSTEEQANGPDAQRHALREWCDRNDAELVAVFEDLGISGGAPLDKRPGLSSALAVLKDKGCGALLVAKRDRLARDTLNAAMLERLAERAGARILAADGTGNGDNPEGLLMRRMVDAFAEYERAIIRARTKTALATKKRRGERVGSIPYGYSLAADGIHLECNETEQRIVSLVVEYRTEGLSLRAVGDRLASRGILPRSGRAWNPKTVSSILRAQAAE